MSLLGAAGAASAVSAIFGSPLVAAVPLMEVAGVGRPPLDRTQCRKPMLVGGRIAARLVAAHPLRNTVLCALGAADCVHAWSVGSLLAALASARARRRTGHGGGPVPVIVLAAVVAFVTTELLPQGPGIPPFSAEPGRAPRPASSRP